MHCFTANKITFPVQNSAKVSTLKQQNSIRPLAFAIACALSSQALAAEQEQSDVVTITGQQASYSNNQSGLKIPLSWQETPQSISIVTEQELDERGVMQLNDAVKHIPGIGLTLGEGSRDQFSIRGFEAMYDIYRNGLRDAGGNQGFRSMANVERVEVIKGVAGALYGRGSAGGLVNLVTKKADGKPITELTLSAGSFNHAGISADVGDQLSDNVNGRINLEYKQQDSFVDHVDGNTLFIAPSLRWKINAANTIDLDLEYLDQDQMPYRGIPSIDGKPIDTERSRFYGSASDSQNNKTLRTTLASESQLTDKLVLKNKLYYSTIDITQSGTRIKGVNDNQVDRFIRNFHYDPQNDYGFQSELTGEQGAHQWLIGAEMATMERTFAMGNLSLELTDLDNPDTSAQDNPTIDPATSSDNKVNSRSVYLQDIYRLNQDLQLIAGLRYDSIETSRKAGGSTVSFEQSEVSPRLAAVYQANDDLNLYATWGRSYQVPWAGIYTSPSKQALQESELQEVGFKLELMDKRLQLSSSLFRINKETPDTDADGIVTDINKQRHQGIELEMRGAITPRWQLVTGLSLLDAENKDSGLRPNDVPEQTFSVWSSYSPDMNWTFAGGARYVSDRTVSNEATTLDAYSVVDMMASYQTGQHKVQLNLNNVLDESYYIGATGGGTGKSNIGYGAPVSAMLSYTISL